MRGVGGCHALADTLEVDLKICVGSESLKLSECFMVENEIHVEEALSSVRHGHNPLPVLLSCKH